MARTKTSEEVGNYQGDQFVDVNQAGRLSGMSVAYWRKRIAEKTIPVYRIGRAVRLKLTDVLAALVRS